MKKSEQLIKQLVKQLEKENPKGLTPKQELIVKLWKAGRNKSEIARTVQTNRQYVYQVLIEQGLIESESINYKRKP
jgi:hypothetical protein